MARINYSAITAAMRGVLEKDPNLRQLNALVTVHEPVDVAVVDRPRVNVFEVRRDSTALQPIGAGTLHRYTIRWDVWCSCFSGESFEDAAAQRDELLSFVETALMANRTLGGIIGNASLMILGGEFRGGPGEGGFISQATVGVTVEQTITI